MGFYEKQILPRAIDKMLGHQAMQKVRRRSMEGLRGEVLEIGFGSGPNVPLYPDEVTRVYAVDPSIVGRKLAGPKVAASPIEVEYVGLDGQTIPLANESVDCVLTTWTLCSIPDVARALTEAYRVLRPGGELFFLEHGLSSDERVARRQRRYTPVQKKLFGGCHLDRDMHALIVDGGFVIDRLSRFNLAGPKTTGSMYGGVAHKPA
jgi:ubiquinone/menaquinone biosynthesis C-methylase UbiE